MMPDSKTSEKDINDVFDDIVFSEDRVVEENYQKGFELGQKDGNIEAYHLGYHRGAELGAEIGFYFSFAESYLKHFEETNNSSNEKGIKALSQLKTLLKSFPHHNDTESDLITMCNNVRGQYKKVCALLKIDSTSISQSKQLSF